MGYPIDRVDRLGPGDLPRLRALNALFGRVFEDSAAYDARPPGDVYLDRLLGNPGFVALVAEEDGHIVGGLAAYVLEKFEQERSELYIYDLAVDPAQRRRGIATALIERLRAIGAGMGAWVIYVQADHGDDPAVALYSRLGVREDVMHFDIGVPVRH